MTRSRLQNKLRDGLIVPKPVDFPYLLFHNEEVDPNNLSIGFLKNELSVQVCESPTVWTPLMTPTQAYKALFLSPSSSLEEGNKGTAKGNAAQHNFDHCNLESVVYTVHAVCGSNYLSALLANSVQAHFGLSSQPT